MNIEKKQTIPSLIVSVESRKGGVGKTTAALCLARLLLKKRFAVLVLDLDVTGTNAADIAKSPFWEKDLHVIREEADRGAENNSEIRPINLITLFDQYFMAGKAIPVFSTLSTIAGGMEIDLEKVNVLGSQIYKTESQIGQDKNEKQKNKQGKGTTCIARPGILFDDLHTLWLLEFIKQITDNFMSVARSLQYFKIAIILDNSPGYVGIAPAIQEWLTDRGPEHSKFLTVTSLDTQDLLACERAIAALHELFTRKWQTSCLFSDAGKEGSGIDVGEDQEVFFMRLAISAAGRSATDDSLAFYRNSKQAASKPKSGSGQRFCDHPASYIAAIINRVPKAVKTGRLVYVLPSILRQSSSTFGQVLGIIDDERKWRERMIYYDEYIENQFLLLSLKRGRRRSERRMLGLINSLNKAENQLRASSSEKGGSSLSLFDMDRQHHHRLRTQLVRINEIVSYARSSVDDAGLGHLSRLVHDEWLPGSIVPDFRSSLMRLLSESDYPFFETMPFELDYSPVNSKARDFVAGLKKHILMEYRHSLMRENKILDQKTSDVLASVLSGLVGLSLTSSFWKPPFEKEMPALFSAVLAFELEHWTKRREYQSSKLGLPRFLAQESVTQTELFKYINNESFRFVKHYMMRKEKNSFPEFYKACTSAQARLVDSVADSRFLIQLLHFMVEGEMKRNALFPFVRGLAEDVIINKIVSHEEAPNRMARALQTVEYFRDFDGVLKKVLAAWGVTHE